MSNASEHSGKIASKILAKMKTFIYTKDQLKNSPSFRNGQMPQNEELEYRQRAGTFCQDLGKMLKVLVILCIFRFYYNFITY